MLPRVATVVLHGDAVIDVVLFGYMDIETEEPLRLDAIHRIYSNAKLGTSVAAMMLYGESVRSRRSHRAIRPRCGHRR